MATIVRRFIVPVLAMVLSVSPIAAKDKSTSTPFIATERSTPVPRLHKHSNRTIMSKSSEYVEQYAQAAMEQMRKYGIPASVTLAQGILESASGQSELSRKGNNHFGIKATQSWLSQGGAYLVYTDDRPNEKFCRYASVADSFEHHSLFLRANSRYDKLFTLAPDDYVGWTRGLQEAGYATSNKYAASLQAVIKSQGLDKYDQMVLQEMSEKRGMGVSESNSTIVQPVAAHLKDGEQIVQATPGQMISDGKANSEFQAANQVVANSNSQTSSQTSAQSVSQTAETQPQNAETKQEKDYFNTVLSSAEDGNSWERFLGAAGSGASSLDPIVEIASTLFAGLMTLALQIDNMEEGAAIQVQQSPANALAAADANALASQNFDVALNSMNNNTVKRSRS